MSSSSNGAAHTASVEVGRTLPLVSTFHAVHLVTLGSVSLLHLHGEVTRCTTVSALLETLLLSLHSGKYRPYLDFDVDQHYANDDSSV